MAHPIEKKIAEREGQIAVVSSQIRDLEMARAMLEAEVKAYRDTLQYVVPADMARRLAKPSKEIAHSGRGISDQWKRWLLTASDYGLTDFGLDDIVGAAELSGQSDVKRPSIRTQAANMVTRGILERVTPGTFRVTAFGAKELGLGPNENGEAKASPDVEQDGDPVQNPNPSL